MTTVFPGLFFDLFFFGLQKKKFLSRCKGSGLDDRRGEGGEKQFVLGTKNIVRAIVYLKDKT